jgi:DNA-directed RNA polymerase sigma subunit (sigma70/sigma32)
LAAVRSVPCFDTAAGVKFVSYVGVAARRAIHRVAFAWKPLPQATATDADILGEVPDVRVPASPRNAAETASEVRRLIAVNLGDRERYLLRQRFGLDGSPPRTYAELAVVTGTSRQNVQQLIQRALRRLRNSLLSDVLKA